MKPLVVLAACVCAALTGPAQAQPIHQLRIYEIFEGDKQAFHERFRDHAQRIMARHGFDIFFMWESKGTDRTEFVYLLEWPDEAAMKAAWTAFMADPEWSRIKRETGARHGSLVGDIEDRRLRLTDYSPPVVRPPAR